MPVTIQPIDLLSRQVSVPSELRTAEWSRLPQWTRERSFWMAGVTEHEILEEMRSIVEREALGEAGEFELRREWEEALDELGYQPEPGQEGTIKDLRSLRRFNIALRTNRALMNGWAQREAGLRPGPVRARPAYELVRIRSVQVPRDWEARWLAAGGELYEGRMMAPKTSEIWERLGSRELFDDALGVNYPPFAWGSGKGWKIVGARECVRVGLMTRWQIREQVDSVIPFISSPGESLETHPRITSPDLRTRLADELQGLARWEDDRLLFTDPNGTRTANPEELQQIWSESLPTEFHDAAPDGLFQRQSVLDFADDPEAFATQPTRDQWDDLARAIGRLIAPDRRREIMARIYRRDDLSWIEQLTRSEAWRAALSIDPPAPRAVRLLETIINLLLP